MKGIVWWVFLVAGFGGVWGLRGEDAPHRFAAETVIVANSTDADSVEIARVYQAMRGIPETNLILLPLSDKLTLSREEFVETLFNPLRAELLERGLFNGDFVGVPDALGRRPIGIVQNKVRYLVLCRGVPLKVRNGAEEADVEFFQKYLEAVRRLTHNPAFDLPDPFKVTRASVDSELSLLAENDIPITGVVLNPLFRKPPETRISQVIRVARLDGPTKEDVLRALEGVRTVEREGLKGRAYFDLRNIQQGGHRPGEIWIDGAREAVEATFFDTFVDREGATIGADDRFDAPAIYVGWYTGTVNGPFKLDGFRFAPGAVAFHLHSFSAGNPRNPDTQWVGPLIAAGASATLGNVAEPYLSQTHQFDQLMRALVAGANFGDAAYSAVACLSWQWALFGDPLYEPFKVSLEAMLPGARELRDPELDPYVILREMNRLDAAGEAGAARDLGIATLEEGYHPALALAVAERDVALDKRTTAKIRLLPMTKVTRFEAQDWMLYAEAARLLESLENSKEATDIYRHLLADERIPRPVEKTLLREGSRSALWVSEKESDAWKARLEAILEEERRAREEAEAKRRAAEEAKEKEKEKAAASD